MTTSDLLSAPTRESLRDLVRIHAASHVDFAQSSACVQNADLTLLLRDLAERHHEQALELASLAGAPELLHDALTASPEARAAAAVDRSATARSAEAPLHEREDVDRPGRPTDSLRNGGSKNSGSRNDGSTEQALRLLRRADDAHAYLQRRYGELLQTTSEGLLNTVFREHHRAATAARRQARALQTRWAPHGSAAT